MSPFAYLVILTFLKLKLTTCQSKVGLNKPILSGLYVYKLTIFSGNMYGHIRELNLHFYQCLISKLNKKNALVTG